MGETDNFQTLTALRAMLDEAGRRPNRRLGQHFLIDRNLMMKLVEAAEIGRRDTVLEVGAGAGSLTGLLAHRAGGVIAVEIDPYLAEIARRNLAKFANVTVLNVDALKRKSVVEPEVIEALRASAERIRGSIKLVANLPYDIATSLVVNLIVGALPVELICFTVQKEVADRFLAAPGTREYGPVSVVRAVFTNGRRICHAPPEAFWPQPKVSSTMVMLERRPPPKVLIDDPASFAGFVRGFFLYRRKTVGHISRSFPNSDRVAAAIAEIRLDAARRPETLTPQEWMSLYNHSR